MPINQLFKKKPSLDLLFRLLSLLNIDQLNGDVNFSKNTIISNNILIKAHTILKELEIFYLPCKKKIYFNNITPKKFITILKQCLNLYNYKLDSKEKYINGTKTILYNICNKNIIEINENETGIKNKIIYENYTLSFD